MAHLLRKWEEAVIDFKIAKASLAIVLRHLGRIVTIFALCCAIGLQWIALQSLAWTTMLIDYSKRAPLCQAIDSSLSANLSIPTLRKARPV